MTKPDAEPDDDQANIDTAYQDGYDAAMEEIQGDANRCRSLVYLATAHRRLAVSLECDDTRETMATLEQAIARVAEKVGR